MENPEAQVLVETRDRRPVALGNLQLLPDELIFSIFELLAPTDIGRLSCVSSVMYILCNEEPLWMILCLKNMTGHFQYKGSWKKTTLLYLYGEHLSHQFEESCRRPLHFDGFSSLFLYRRLYRCRTTLAEFSFDDGNVERKKDLSLEEFSHKYDGQKPILLAGLADTWPARSTWSADQLLLNYGDTAFKISQKSSGKIKMTFRDYVTYMKLQHDEDPLYIFDDKFAEVAPGLLKDYRVPYLFQEDYFNVLDRDQRPPFRWLIIGPERSGASWHVDPALTSAWNTLLCGRKRSTSLCNSESAVGAIEFVKKLRWALYPPGKVPLGVTVHINEEDGDVNIETPSSLQWWLDFYPLLSDEDKPIECTQLPGETIYVPSGWWHCVLNLETTIAVTQNFVNSKNLEFVCLDMAPGYRHKGVCRVGLLVLDDGSVDDAENCMLDDEDSLSNSDLMRKEKRIKNNDSVDDPDQETTTNSASRNYNLWKQGFSYDINLLSKFLDEERDHYNFPWSSGNCMGQREMREWLSKLWVRKPGIRDLTWKGACIALNANKWLERLAKICNFHDLPSPTDDERLPVSSGSNPVYLMGGYVTKIFIEGGLEASIHGLGAELELYSLLHKVDSPLRNHIPDVVASGILFYENGSYTIVPWDGKGVPEVIQKFNLIPKKFIEDGFAFGVWHKKMFEYKRAGMSGHDAASSAGCTWIWPYMITKRCKGKMFAQLRDKLSWEDALNLASFLGEQLRNLHLLPYPPINDQFFSDIEQERNLSCTNGDMEHTPEESNIPAEWVLFTKTLTRKKDDVSNRLTTWGDPIPRNLIEKVNDYIPHDFEKFLDIYEGDNGLNKVDVPCCWIHSDIMDDNIFMEQSSVDVDLVDGGTLNEHDSNGERKSWHPSYILDFSNLSIGDPLCDIIPLHLDVFRGDPTLLEHFLESYKLPLSRRLLQRKSDEGGNKFEQPSYRAMCYCILHDDNVLGAIFSIWEELRKATSWEEVEHTVWGDLNYYRGSY